MNYASQLLHTFQLDPEKKIKNLSRGMKAQVCLVSAVAHRPQLLIMDEPSSGLDAVVRQDILNAIVRSVVDAGRTVVFSSHLLEEVERLSDHVTMIHDGRVAFDDSLEIIKERFQRSQVRFDDRVESIPDMEGVMAINGEGRSWHIIHEQSASKIRDALAERGGTIIESRGATLEEIFVARVGRPYDSQAA